MRVIGLRKSLLSVSCSAYISDREHRASGRDALVRATLESAPAEGMHSLISTTLKLAALLILTCCAPLTAAYSQSGPVGGATPSPPGAAVYFIDLQNGATLGPTTTIYFGLRGMGVAPAGASKENTGHHHLLIDADLPPPGQPIPSDFSYLHFGNGQTQAEVSLSPGDHTLQLLLGDHNHAPHSPPVKSERITVHVLETNPVASAPPKQKARKRDRR